MHGQTMAWHGFCPACERGAQTRGLSMDIAATLHQLGVALEAYTGADLTVRSPIDGSQLASLRCHTRAEVQASIAQAAEAFTAWRDVPWPQGTPGAPGDHGMRQDSRRGTRGSTGNDRYVRFRRGPVASALWAHDRFRAARAQHAGDLVASGSHGGAYGVQFPSGCVVVECGPGARLRRPCGLEAFGKDAPRGPGLPGDFRAGLRALYPDHRPHPA